MTSLIFIFSGTLIISITVIRFKWGKKLGKILLYFYFVISSLNFKCIIIIDKKFPFVATNTE
jgi:hypothetical protein